MAIPETDALRIGIWCRDRVPQELWHELRVECEITDRHVTIIETRSPWDGADRPWTRLPIARLRYTATTGSWTIYWRDRNSKFHLYQDSAPSTHVQPLLDHIADSGDPIFWG